MIENHEVVTGMAFVVPEKNKILQYSAEWQQEVKFIEATLEVHLIKQ